MNLQAIFKEMTPRARIGLGVAAVGFLAITFFLLKLATAPSYATVMTGVQPNQSDKITQALADRGVSYELQNNGTAIAVEKSQIGDARVALANAGVNAGSGTQPGFELLDQQKLGSSDFQQRITYQRALEGEIGNTIGQIDGVNGAEVQLTLPEDKLFSDESNPATAAVLLSGTSTLDGAQVRGIANLVAGSVQGLSPDKVTITDGAGQLLWPTDGAGGSGGTASKAAAQARYDSATESRLNDMLTRVLGPNKARVEVATDLNMDSSNKEELAYGKESIPLSQKVDDETLKGGGAGGGTSGTAANIQGSTAAGAGAGSDYKHRTTDTQFGVGKVVTKTKVAPGAVNNMQVALLVDSSVPKATANQLTAMVSSAAGLNTKRGDTINMSTFAFAKTPVAKSPSPITPTGIIGMLKYVLAGLAAIVFLFLVSRGLKRRENADLAEPTWLREIEQPRPLAELVASLEASAGGGEQGALGMGAAAGSGREQLAAVAAQDPERLARQLREWMTEGDA